MTQRVSIPLSPEVGQNSMWISADAAASVLEPLRVVWAKCSGYPSYPALVSLGAATPLDGRGRAVCPQVQRPVCGVLGLVQLLQGHLKSGPRTPLGAQCDHSDM